MTILICLLAAVWFASPFLIYGMAFAHFQKKYPTIAEQNLRSDKRFALIQALVGLLFGPIYLIAVFFLSERAKHGLKF